MCALAWLAFTCGRDAPEESAGSPGERAFEPEAAPSRRPGDPPTAQRETLEALRQAQRAPRHPSDGGGRAWLEPDSTIPAQAGRSGRWAITYEAGPDGIALGGFVRLTVPYFWWNWSPAQTRVSEAPG